MINKLESFVPRPALAYGLLCLTSFFWASGMVLTRGYHQEIPAFGLSFWRWTVASLFLLPLVWPELLRRAADIRRHLPLFIWLGILQTGGATLMVIALNLTTAINASLVNAALPVGAALAAWLLVRERSSVVQSIGIALALVGVGTMVARADLQVVINLAFSAGDMWAVLAVAGWSVYAVHLRRIPRHIGALTSLFLIFAAGAIFILPFYIVETVFFEPVEFGIPIVVTASYVGLLSSVVSIYIWNVSIRAVGPARATIFINLIPVFGAALAISFLGEQLFLFHIAGALMVAVGIYLVTRPKREAAVDQ